MHTVIIADDEHMIKKSLSIMLESTPYNFKVIGEANDGQVALNLVKKLNPDLLITDIRMPITDGLELIDQLQKGGFSTKIIVVSGYGEFEYAQKALRFGAIDYLLKPIKIDLAVKAFKRVNDILQSEKRINPVAIDQDLFTTTDISPKIIQALKFMEENFNDQTLSLLKISEYVELSTTYFSRIFKEEIGTNFVQYLTKLRMEKSKDLLENPYFKIYEVAYSIGYTDYAHFSKAFKKYHGMSPYEYRKQLFNQENI